jgi:LAGLIDADG DNA endonuclease family
MRISVNSLRFLRSPSNILSLFTDVSLAYFIMGDGYWDNDQNTVELCTDNFTELEVQTILSILYSKLGLITTESRRVQPNAKVCWRVIFSGKAENLNLLRQLVSPYMPSMMYKFGC